MKAPSADTATVFTHSCSRNNRPLLETLAGWRKQRQEMQYWSFSHFFKESLHICFPMPFLWLGNQGIHRMVHILIPSNERKSAPPQILATFSLIPKTKHTNREAALTQPENDILSEGGKGVVC